ncbi:unnamed protein product, partial [Ectocarpus sp. 12 AP-2014]
MHPHPQHNNSGARICCVERPNVFFTPTGAGCGVCVFTCVRDTFLAGQNCYLDVADQDDWWITDREGCGRVPFSLSRAFSQPWLQAPEHPPAPCSVAQASHPRSNPSRPS